MLYASAYKGRIYANAYRAGRALSGRALGSVRLRLRLQRDAIPEPQSVSAHAGDDPSRKMRRAGEHTTKAGPGFVLAPPSPVPGEGDGRLQTKQAGKGC